MLNKHTSETVNIDAVMSALEDCTLVEAALLATNTLELSRLVIERILVLAQEQQTGEEYSHHRPYDNRYQRWGSSPGSVKLQSQRVPIEVPRNRDTHTGRTHSPDVDTTFLWYVQTSQCQSTTLDEIRVRHHCHHRDQRLHQTVPAEH
jgi:hypothetical protein